MIVIDNRSMKYYEVAKGHNIGIYLCWNDCKQQVIGYKGAIYKKFNNEEEAENYILNCNSSESTIHENIYFKYNNEDTNYYIYTDGSCLNNGKVNSISGIGIYFNDNDIRNVSKILNEPKYKCTNNSAEINAILEAYKIIKYDLIINKICIVTDSEYCIKCATSYGEKCSQNNWSKNIPNKDLVKQLYYIYNNEKNLKLFHVKAHTNLEDIHSKGNANADKLAYNAIKKFI